jgi:PKD repeat protein
MLNFKTVSLFCCKTCISFVLGIMRVSSRSLVSPAMTIGITLVAVLAIVIILLAPNITITNAQQQEPLISRPPTAVSQNGTRLVEDAEDSFRLQVPEGWIIHDVNNTGSILSEESTQGYGILAQLCPQEQQQQQQRAALPNAGGNSSRTFNSCDQSENDIIHIVRYPDLDNRLQVGNNGTTANNNNMTIDNILLYHMQKLEEVGYRGIEIVNSTDTTLNVTDPQTNQTITTVPAKFVEMTYSTVSAPNEIREGYFILTATKTTAPNPGMTKGYSIFYEGTSTAAGAATAATIQKTTTTTAASVSLAPIIPPAAAAVQQIFDSFELIAAQEVVGEEEEPTSSPLRVEITSSETEGGRVVAPATFEFEADVAGVTEPYTYSWDFDDDGGSSSEESDDDDETISHTFEEAGRYNVRLTVTDSIGQRASDSVQITVEAPPAAADEVNVDDEEEQPIITQQPLTVDISSSETEGGRVVAPATFEFEADVAGVTEPYTISWNFGDGSSEESDDDDETISHTFEEAGRYNVGAIVTDSSGRTASDSIRITIKPSPPLTSVEIISSGAEGVAPATFEFEADVAGVTEPYTYSWDFDDDGRSSNEQTISHTFEEAGRYNVRLTVTDSIGQRASDSVQITVEAPSPPPTIREPSAQGEDTISEDNPPPQQAQPDSAPPTAPTEKIPAEQPTAQGNNQGGEATTEPHTSSLDFDGNGASSSEERSDDDDDENVDHIFDEAGSHNDGDRTVTDSEDQRVSDSIEDIVEAPPEEPQEEEPSTQEIPAEQPTAEEVKPDLSDADNNSGADDLIDVDDLFDVDEFIDDLFVKLGLDN